MPKMMWKDTMSVGVESLDAQHRTMIAMINELDDALYTAQSEIVIGSVISKLVEYTEHHFDYEENCMLVACYARLRDHKCQHDILREKVCRLRDAYAEQQQGIGEELVKTLEQWLQVHIRHDDKQYSTQLAVSGMQ